MDKESDETRVAAPDRSESMTAQTTTSARTRSAGLHRFSLKDYARMGRLGLIENDDRVELLDGLLVKKMTKGPRHASVTYRIFVSLIHRLPAGWLPRQEFPIILPGGPVSGAPSAPEPDVAVVRGDPGHYETRHPSPDDVALVVEVAGDARMLARDRKGLPRYAWNQIPVVWIVNLSRNVIEVYTNPTGPGELPEYQAMIALKPGDPIAVVLDGAQAVVLDVGQILG